MKYAGIGSRKSVKHHALTHAMIDIGRHLAKEGWTLRSGGSVGCDEAFEKGCDAANGKREIFLPWKHFNNHPSSMHKPSPEAFKMAAKFVPWWSELSDGDKKMHARNVHQVLGYTLNDPVDVVICWTPHGRDVGGTRTALMIARHHGIPVINLADVGIDHNWSELLEFMEAK